MIFCERLKELRIQSPYTQKQLAKMLGVTEVAYQLYEYGKHTPNLEKIFRLAMIFDVTLDDLLCFEDYKRAHSEE